MRCATQKFVRSEWAVRARWLVFAAACLAGAAAMSEQEPTPPKGVAQAAYRVAEEQFHKQPDDPERAWQFGRACFDWAEFSTNDTQRAELAHQGIAACEAALEKDSQLAAAYYYLGMNQGQLARTMNLGALKLVRQMEAHFLKARELDPNFDLAGPDRNLGLLYLQAPGWPVSLGNRAKARDHLERAVKLAPYFPENRLNLMEAYAQWDKSSLLKRELKDWEADLDAARRQFSGTQWHWAWVHWQRRLEALKQQASRTAPVLRSPKDRG